MILFCARESKSGAKYKIIQYTVHIHFFPPLLLVSERDISLQEVFYPQHVGGVLRCRCPVSIYLISGREIFSTWILL